MESTVECCKVQKVDICEQRLMQALSMVGVHLSSA
jgi:hypothetical protein